jgi:hypothetical protein
MRWEFKANNLYESRRAEGKDIYLYDKNNIDDEI